MKNITRFAVLLSLFVFTPLLCFSQAKIDTVYYNAELKVISDPSKADTYEIRTLGKRGKPEGPTKRFNQLNELVETTTYEKGRKTGFYMLVKGDSIIRGTYARDKQIDLWTYEHKETSIGRVERYNDQGQRIRIDQPLPDDMAEKLQINSDTFFPGGPTAWTGFLRKTLRYPASAKSSGTQGAVRIKFIVSETGSIEDIAVVSSPGPDLSEEAIRIMQQSPNWVPARKEGKKTPSEMSIQIVFRMN